MERRLISHRRPRRMRVQFLKRGDSHQVIGFTSNVSSTGMFIVTAQPLAKGSRVRVEVLDPPGLAVEALVVHSVKVPPGLEQVRQSGMGVRFLIGDELLADLLAPAPTSSGSLPVVGTPEMPRPPSRQIERINTAISTGAPGNESARTAPPAAPREVGPPADGIYRVRFRDAQEFLEAFHRDMRNGGVFVHTRFPAPLNSQVSVEIHLPTPSASGRSAILASGTVAAVRVVDRAAPDSEHAGMGVLFQDAQHVILQLLPAVQEAESR